MSNLLNNVEGDFHTTNTAQRGNFPIGIIKNKNRFLCRLNIKSKSFFLGRFNTPEEAFQVYKAAKEKQIKEVADDWKDKIEPRVYQAMYDYQVEITD